MTGEKDLNASAILEYFDPLFKYLKEVNGPIKEDTELENFITNDYEPSASQIENSRITAEWNFAIDISNSSKQKEQV